METWIIVSSIVSICGGLPHFDGGSTFPDDAEYDGRGPDPDVERVVWIGEGTQIGYLPEIARNALGHNWS
jgi:hypothetical protein